MTEARRPTRLRGPHPRDAEEFAEARLATLRRAVFDLSWLLGRGYKHASALKLVGDKHQLTGRQRLAVASAACSDGRRADRAARRVAAEVLVGRELVIDGFNCLITLEAALSGAAIFVGRDGAHRDLSRLRGSYRPMAHTEAAAARVGELLATSRVARATWCLDRPVSNSGRLAGLLRALAADRGWPWEVALTDGTDRAVAATPDVAASSDAWILDQPVPWVDLPGEVLARHEGPLWRVDLAPDAD